MSPRLGSSHRPRTGMFDHAEWLGLMQVSGPFLSVPVLRRAWPAGLDTLESTKRSRLRAEHADYFDVPDAARNRDDWICYVLADLLGWSDLARFGPEMPERLTLEVPEHGETVRPTFGLVGRDGALRLLGLICDGLPTGRVIGSSWAASPADRLARIMRRNDVPLGLTTDGRYWVLVWAPHDRTTTEAVFDASLWREEPDLLRAFLSLLCRARFFGVPDEETLAALLEQSQDNQEEITEALGIQVRQAVELLIAAIGRAEQEIRRHRPEISPLEAHQAYVGAVTVMMRVVFLLFAEERHLLPIDDPIYQAHYSASRLVNGLEERASEPGGEAALAYTHVAWHQLLALFRAIHRGVRGGSLHLPPYDGSLFDPDVHPWLEGRFTRHDNIHTEVLLIDDRTVLHMLKAVQYIEVGTGKGRERRRLSFAELDVEQIGYVYECLLGFDAFHADDDVLGLTGRPGEEEEISLTEIEDHAAAITAEQVDTRALAEWLAERYTESGIGSATAIAKRLAPLAGYELADARRNLLSATGNDTSLAERLLRFYRLLRPDLSGLPTVFRKGTMYVTQSPLRRLTGTHYTPKFLAEQVVEGALAPLVYSPGPLQTADARLWKLRPSAEILNLKIADIAVGSGAHLVAAARYLAARLIEAWAAEGDTRATRRLADAGEGGDTNGASSPTDTETDPQVISARRLIIEHCLYGVDINPMAVEMAKLSLWLVSMHPAPFTFVDDKLACGDSLLGITDIEQLEWMHLEPRRGRALHENRPWAFNRGAREVAAEVVGLREEISWLTDSPEDHGLKRKLLSAAKDKVSAASKLADLVTGAAVAEASRAERKYDPNMVAANLARIAAERPDDGWDRLADQTWEWLNIDRSAGGFSRTPLHWPLVFPEVFLEQGGFDAVVGNLPFLGGQKLTGALGKAYREYLVKLIGKGTRGSADRVAYFVLRAHRLLNLTGQTGLLATNTLAQGDTREVGLDQIIEDGVTIRQAVKSSPWPSRSAALEYCAIWTTRAPLAPGAKRVADGIEVRNITSSLDPEARVTGSPRRLAANAGISFIGSYVLGMGFTMEPEQAKELIHRNPDNAQVLFPYINGQDLNTQPDSSASRWVINFHDWPIEVAKQYTDPFLIVSRTVRHERLKNNRKVYRHYWWRYAERRPAMVKAIADLDRIIVVARVSKPVMPVIVRTGQVMSEQTVVFATEDAAVFATLSGAFHYWWAVTRSSTLESRIRYTPSDVFETFPLAKLTREMRDCGTRLDVFRRELMLARRAGLTKTYNLVHDPRCTDEDIAELREIHRKIDRAVARAYNWDDIDLDHGFHDTRQGVRYTVGPVAQREILDRLLELNHERYAAEVAVGLHERHGQGRDAGEQEELFGS